MTALNAPNEQGLNVSNVVLGLARKRHVEAIAAGIEICGLSTPDAINHVEVIAGKAWRIGTTAGRGLINLLDEFSESVPKALKSFLRARDRECAMIIGYSHRDFLLNAIDGAQESLCIVSGWLSKRVIDPELVERVKLAIERGVDIFVGYGYEYQGEHQEKKDSKFALAILRTVAKAAKKERWKGSLTVGRYATHEKVLILDKAVIVSGSNNWLSNASFVNDESSLIIENADLAKNEYVRVRKQVLANAVIP